MTNCISLLTDFGLQDASVASAKGILMQHVTDATIIDISHLTEPFHIQQAAYLLQSAYRNFPTPTCHIVLCDVFSEKNPRLLLYQKENYFFLAPDNGILSLAFGNEDLNVIKCYELKPPDSFRNWLEACGGIAEKIFKNDQVPGEAYTMRNAPHYWQPMITQNSIECHVIHIDRFENVVINLTRKIFDEVGQGRPFSIRFMRDEEIDRISRYHSDVPEGDVLCRFNSTGFLEICINKDRAASLLGLKLRKDQNVMYNTVKIYFE